MQSYLRFQIFLGVCFLVGQISSASHREPKYVDSRPTTYGALPPENYCMKAPVSSDGRRNACGGFSNRECDQFCDKYGFSNGWCGHPTIDALKKRYCLCHNGVCDTGYLQD